MHTSYKTGEISFLLPNHPSQQKIFHEPFNGKGMYLTIEVEDVGKIYKKLSKKHDCNQNKSIISSWNIASSDGMNEKGLVGNLLWLAESTYPEFKEDSDQTGLAISLWLQYAPDNFATVDKAVETFRKESFVVTTANIPPKRFTWQNVLVLSFAVPLFFI